MHKREKDELTASISKWIAAGKYKRELVKDFKPDLLNIDSSYQRQIISTTVEDMKKKWCPFSAGTLHVSKRHDGKYFVIDGQHRKVVAAKIGKSVDVNIIDLSHLSTIQARKVEAWIFLNENKHRKSMSQSAIINAEFKIGYEEATGIIQMCNTYGFNLSEQPKHLNLNDWQKFCNLTCVKQLRRCYRQETLERILEYLDGIKGRLDDFSKPISDFQSESKWLTMLSTIVLKKGLDIEDMVRISKDITNEDMSEIKTLIGSRNADDKWLKLEGTDEVIKKYPQYFYKEK